MSIPGAVSTRPVVDDHREISVLEQRRAETDELLAAFAALPHDHPDREDLQRRIVEHYSSFVMQQARRYRNRGEPLEDIVQAGMLGLVKAIQGFDPSVGRPFLAYATPMVLGEIKRHFRDRTWAVHVPRRLQEKRSELNRFTADFAQRTGRAPTTAEIGKALELDEEEAGEVIIAASAYSAMSLDVPVGENEEPVTLADVQGEIDLNLENVVDREALAAALESLPARELKILLLRFFGNKTQSEIAGLMGISQMHVSRLLSKALARLRAEMSR
ncbi:SigB/SigF/SigG family RNA polymerase sigma factor [Marinactinospora thermotolerans]|uniref:SigB/SigF/SigG family RNA polymerase sigma factor n=1 Tax=Marinactinospora thermotolerans TaxID=531310 RepID=UPI001F481B27|nr:SigB/SigF/SigG family RNA polymerase sigma factor [Marinactinospora thermotolerans]